ncbi:ferric reductase-like transmembrane domain-containing protein [Actinotalea sp.]|uniref:ferredoxin reductase family protein n=1 Tax=Actinotalea sp. TaxID=1872145 RepID=UPI0035691FBB
MSTTATRPTPTASTAPPRIPPRRAAHASRPVLRLRPPTLRRWWTDAVGLTVWGSMLVVVALWVHHGGFQDLTAGAAASLSSIGRLSGLISSDLLLLQVLAMARVPFIERSIGQDRLARWHRWVGFSSMNLILVHLVTITIGYALFDGSNVLREFWDLTTNAPGMLLALAGTIALGMVSVTSMRFARRKLRYESWHLLHLYAYLGAGLALPHQLWTGSDFLLSTAATVYWWSLYGLVMVAVLIWRVIVPLRTSLRQRLRVTSVVPDGAGAVSVTVAGPHLDELRVSAGQFFVWRFRTGPGWTRGHPLSLSAAPTTAGLRVTIGVTGDDGERIARMPVGTTVLVEGPYGRLRPEVRTRENLVLIGSGLGLAPLVALAQEAVLAGRGGTTTLVRRLRSEQDVPMQADVEHLRSLGRLQVIDLVGPRSTVGTAWLPRQHGHLPGQEAVHRLIPRLDTSDVFVCGAAPWAEAVAADLHAAGLPHTALHVERFSW